MRKNALRFLVSGGTGLIVSVMISLIVYGATVPDLKTDMPQSLTEEKASSPGKVSGSEKVSSSEKVSRSKKAKSTQGNQAEKTGATVFQFDNPAHQAILNTPTQPVKKLPDPEIDQTIKILLSTMQSNIGGGISANQIGKSLQLMIIAPPFSVPPAPAYQVFINPVITRASRESVCFWHGCLSSKGKDFGRVGSWQNITVSALDQAGKTIEKELNGLDAIVFQHEFRHLLGGGYHEHSSDFKSEGELMKLMLQRKIKLFEPCALADRMILEDYQLGETIEAYSVRIKKENKKADIQKALKTGRAAPNAAVNPVPVR